MQDRTLLISPDGPYLIYPYYKRECKWLVICPKKRIVEKYDLTDDTVRKSLIDMGFRVISTQRFDYK
jgi:hypothetical protein